MEITVREGSTDPEVTVVELLGEMDIGPTGVDRFHQVLDGLVEAGERRIVVDLAQASYIVSRGFGQMLVALARLRTRGGDLRAAAAKGAVWAAASAVGLDNIIKFYETADEALQSFVDEARNP
ncbi:MAG: STAS domain-containing protein [Armatimonadetes bacterium]|nr:STAS domain-containing protein [Armatimonadota bacterium]